MAKKKVYRSGRITSPNYVSIDKDKLYDRLADRRLSPSDVSRIMGKAEGYIAGTLASHGGLPSVIVSRLQDEVGIDMSTVVKDSEPAPVVEVAVKPDSALSDQDWARLYRLLVEAFKEALNS